MPAPPSSTFQYAVLRVVPHVERGEFVNAGVVLFARTERFLDARVGLDRARLAALAPDTDPEPVEHHLQSLAAVAVGESDAGPIARLDQSERFNWLVAPASTVIQPSPVHTGICHGPPDAILDSLFRRLVAAPGSDRT